VFVAILLLRLQIHASCPETFVLGSIILALRPSVRIHIFRFMNVFVNKLYIIQFTLNGSRKEEKMLVFIDVIRTKSTFAFKNFELLHYNSRTTHKITCLILFRCAIFKTFVVIIHIYRTFKVVLQSLHGAFYLLPCGSLRS
jgi:hypothetical protein